MIAKRYRLNEEELRKVLRMRKPFFSYTLVANIADNKLWHARFWIVFSGKQTRTSISRNFFRRLFYETARPFIGSYGLDIAFVPKKWKEFDHHDEATILEFRQTVAYLLRKIGKEIKNTTSQNLPFRPNTASMVTGTVEKSLPKKIEQ